MRKLLIILLILPTVAIAQKERADIRAGNKFFASGKFTEAEVDYKRALEKNIKSYEANFNLGGALYKQGRNEEAAASYQKILEDGTDPNAQAKSFYNLGNALVKQRKLDEAIESYKNSLRLDPTDIQAKFNLAYAQKLKQEDENKDKDKDKNQDQNQDKNQDPNQDPNKDDKDKDKDKKDDKKEQQEQPNQSKAEAERMLKAVQASEDNTKKKVDEQKAQAVGKGTGKQW